MTDLKTLQDSSQPIDIPKLKKYLKQKRSLVEISNYFDVPPKTAEKALQYLVDNKFNVHLKKDIVSLETDLIAGGRDRIDLRGLGNKVYKFGFVTDAHLGSNYERLDILNAVFDIFEQEGVTTVYSAGNDIDGEARFNKFDIHKRDINEQVTYWAKEYPQRKGITTKFITGDDHEGWYVQREGINIGEFMQDVARKNGREDLQYIGHMESTIELRNDKGCQNMNVMHPGGGSSYALSYAPQKIIESLTGGEKPAILLIGHYHKAEFLPAYRNVDCFSGGTTQDQTPFMRKKKLAAHLGGWIIEIQQSKDGAINRCKGEWLKFFDKQYYKKWYYRN